MSGNFEGVEADGEGALEGGGRARQCQGGRGGAFGGESEFGEVRDDFGDIRGVGAEALIELLRSQKLMEFGVAGSMDCGEEFFGFVAIAHAQSDGDGERSLRAECSTVYSFGSVTRWKG